MQPASQAEPTPPDSAEAASAPGSNCAAEAASSIEASLPCCTASRPDIAVDSPIRIPGVIGDAAMPAHAPSQSAMALDELSTQVDVSSAVAVASDGSKPEGVRAHQVPDVGASFSGLESDALSPAMHADTATHATGLQTSASAESSRDNLSAENSTVQHVVDALVSDVAAVSDIASSSKLPGTELKADSGNFLKPQDSEPMPGRPADADSVNRCVAPVQGKPGQQSAGLVPEQTAAGAISSPEDQADNALAVDAARPPGPADCGDSTSNGVQAVCVTAGASPSPEEKPGYAAEDFATPPAEHEIDRSAAQLQRMNCVDPKKRNNIFALSDHMLLTSVGNSVIFYNMATGEQTFLRGLDGGGIGAVGYHAAAEHSLIVIAEKCKSRAPNAYVYALCGNTNVRLLRVLKGGTEQSYSAVAFNNKGTMLATVGSYPDYMLTLWNWDSEEIILRSKAFSQEVYNVSFSPYFEGLLTTSGTGHIRFWKMASTFTGVKLQGALGKFGKVELSDVCAFAEFPDGKVLSGTETGDLLLWDGNLIKAVFKRKGASTCHDGNVEVLTHSAAHDRVVSAGADGVVRLWDASKIMDAEPADGEHEVELECLAEVKIGDGVRIKDLIECSNHWLVLDEAGHLIKATFDGPTLQSELTGVSTLSSFHSGAISALACDPSTHDVITAGEDGTLRVHHAQMHATTFSRTFATAITCMAEAPAATQGPSRLYYTGHQHGFLRRVLRCTDGWRMTHCVRPHKGAVAALAVSPDGSQLVTAGSDHTLMFFSTAGGTALESNAFVYLGAAALHVVWTEAGVVVACDNDLVMRVEVPALRKVAELSTLEVEARVQEFTFQVPKAMRPTAGKRPLHGSNKAEAEGDVAETAGDEQEKYSQLGEGSDAELDTISSEDEAWEQEGHVPVHGVFPCPASADSFLLSLSTSAAAHLFICSFGAGAEPLAVASMPAGVSFAAHSTTGWHFLLGAKDGAVRVYPLQTPHSYPTLTAQYWETQAHDMHSSVTGVTLSADNALLVSTASDGSIATHRLCCEAISAGTLQEGLQDTQLQPLAKQCEVEGEDMIDLNAYTLEEAKQKLEADAVRAAAEQKKMSVREVLAGIKQEFEELLAENEARPQAEQLPRSHFDIDPDMRTMIEQELRQAEEDARAEMQWEFEKQRVALAKIRAEFLDNVEVERIVLRSMSSAEYVTSFRTAKQEAWVLEELQKVADQSQALSASTEDQHAVSEVLQVGRGKHAAGHLRNARQSVTTQQQGLTKQQIRQAARAQRAQEWEAFMKTKPDDSYEDAASAKAIQHAECHKGDFMLKTDPLYKPPDGRTQTADNKRRQMALLEDGIYRLKMDFNRRFLALRDVKRSICQHVAEKTKALARINQGLGISEELFVARMHADEEPEQRDIVTDADIEAHLRSTGDAVVSKAAAGGHAGPTAGVQARPAASSKNGAAAPHAAGSASRTTQDIVEDLAARSAPNAQLSGAEKAERMLTQRKLESQRRQLKTEIQEMLSTFDAALNKLRGEKFALEGDIKAAEIWRLVMWKELTLLQDFSKTDAVLAEKLADRHHDRKEVLDRMKECQKRLEDYKEQVAGVAKKKSAIAAMLDSTVAESHPCRDALVSIFNRKIKRSKKRVTGDATDMSGDEDSDEEDDFDDDDDDDDEQEICPPGCDLALYDKVCTMREQRLDQDDILSDISKSCEQVKKEQELLKQKLKRLEQSVSATELDIQEYQLKKQAALNEIEVTVAVHLHQIEYLSDGRLPLDMSGALIFSNDELSRLRSRIDELALEKQDLRKAQHRLKKQHVQLIRDKKAKEAHLAELDARALDVQMLKFGRQVDLELLDNMGPSQGSADLRSQVRAQSARFAAELAEWDRKIAARTTELASLTQENTAHLQQVAQLSEQKKNLEHSMKITQKELFRDPVANMRQEAAERDHLVQVVNDQAKEIEYLATQIGLLKRKDSSLYG